MKILRLSFLLMLILTLTLVIVSCDDFDREDRIENKQNSASNPSEQANGNDVPNAQAGEEQKDLSVSEPDGGAQKNDRPSVSDVDLTKEDAESIALAHAGVAAADALQLRSEFDIDDGVPVYEVEFYVAIAGRNQPLEYDYTVHAENGTILEVDVDRD